MNTYTTLFICFLAASFAVQLWLSLRHSGHIGRHRRAVPEAFADQVPLADHQKAADYSIAKGRIGRIELAWGTLLLLAWTLGGGLELLDNFWRTMDWSPEWTGASVFFTLMLFSGFFDLPFDIYRTFILEDRFGFNRTTVKTWLSDKIKGIVLMLILGLPLLWVVLTLMENAGENWWFYVWLVWSGFMLLMMWAFPTFIAPLFNKFSPLEDETLRDRIEKLLERCGFSSNGLFVMDGSKRSSHGNAYFTGFGSNKRIVFFDTLLDSLDENQVEAVLAHELGHFKHRHVQIRIVVSILSTLAALAVLGWLMQQSDFYTGLGVTTPSTYMALLLFMMVSPVFLFFLNPISSALSRRHEFQADDYAAQQSDANALVQALVTMYRDNASTLTPDPLHSAFYDSHPPAPIRVAHLQALKSV